LDAPQVAHLIVNNRDHERVTAKPREKGRLTNATRADADRPGRLIRHWLDRLSEISADRTQWSREPTENQHGKEAVEQMKVRFLFGHRSQFFLGIALEASRWQFRWAGLTSCESTFPSRCSFFPILVSKE
jgi:hypothetical protein